MERDHSETNITQDPDTGGTISDDEGTKTSQMESERLKLTLAFLGVILTTLGVIFAGYKHGHMSISAVYHSLTKFN